MGVSLRPHLFDGLGGVIRFVAEMATSMPILETTLVHAAIGLAAVGTAFRTSAFFANETLSCLTFIRMSRTRHFHESMAALQRKRIVCCPLAPCMLFHPSINHFSVPRHIVSLSIRGRAFLLYAGCRMINPR